jgi:ribosomal protein S18 acetylase RimI-like enzyme
MKDSGYCEMKRLFVSPGYRTCGIGKRLVNLLIELARDQGYAFIRLDTFKKLKAAIRLYESVGFYFIESYYQNPYSEVVYMEKRLSEAGVVM